jgi:hypothetical protein
MHKLYDEDRLPEDQPPILTSNVKDLLTFVYLLTDSDRLYSTIGVVTAWAGEGKTIAALVCQKEIENRFQSILPVTIRVKVMPRSTSKTLAKDIMEELGEQARGDNSSQLASDAALSIERNNLRLLIFDEADRLNDDSFEVVRYLLVRMSFKSLSLEEVLTMVLPGFVFQRWSFNPNDEADRQMGEAIWRKVCPSLRNLRSLLDNANILAKAKGEEKITLPLINDAYVRFMAQEEQYLYDNRSKTSSQGQLGSHEEISVKRHEAHGPEKKNT